MIIFLSYTTTPGLIENFVHTYHSHIYYTSTYCHFLTLQIAVCLSCQTQQAIHNVLCDVLWQKQIINKQNMEKKNQKNNFKKNNFKKNNFKKIISKKNVKFIFIFFLFKNKFFSPIKFASYHTHRITLVVSHSSYHTPTLLPVEYDEYWCDKHNTGI